MCASLQVPLCVIDDMSLHDFNGVAVTLNEMYSDIKSNTGKYARKRYPRKISDSGMARINKLKQKKK